MARSSDLGGHIRIDGVSRRIGNRRILTDIGLSVGAGARVGLIGENGSGKSTLLRIVAGVDQPDSGTVAVPARTAFLRQELPYADGAIVRHVLDDAVAEARTAAAEVEDAAAALAIGEAGADSRLAEALEAAERSNAWSTDSRRDEVRAGMGIDQIDLDTPVGSLSGGQRSRVAMAALLLSEPTALLLDEPTNHLDDDAVGFLEKTLAEWSGPVIFASHDRVFLTAVATSIVDLDPAPMPLGQVPVEDDSGAGYGLHASRGDYTDYVAARHADRERWRRRYAEEQSEMNTLRQTMADSSHSFRAGAGQRSETRASKKFFADKGAKTVSRQIRSAQIRLEVMEREQVRKPPERLTFAGIESPRSRDPKQLVVQTVAAAVSGRLQPIDFFLESGKKVLVTGGNGTGKSTLLRVLDGALQPTSGKVVRGAGVRTGLLEQDVIFKNPDLSARRVYAETLSTSRAEETPLASLGLLAARDLDRSVGTLSVGQQRRLALAVLIADPPDLLLLDEPTNHLSLSLVEELEQALTTVIGAVVLASHDRWLRRHWTDEIVRIGE